MFAVELLPGLKDINREINLKDEMYANFKLTRTLAKRTKITVSSGYPKL